MTRPYEQNGGRGSTRGMRFIWKQKMLRRKAKLEDLGALGAFVDTEGSRRKTKRSRRRERGDEEREGDEVEEKLESLVFGRPPFQPSTAPQASLSEESDGEAEDVPSKDPTDVVQPRKPAWLDEDDEEITVDISAHQRLRKLRRTEGETTVSGATYNQRLRTQFEKLMGQPEWAAFRPKRKRQHREISDLESGSESEEEEEGLLQRTGNLLAGTVEKLPGGSLDVRRMRDANSAKRAEAVVRAVEFHPSSSVLLTAGYHKTLDLFQVDGQANSLLQSVHVERFPMCSAHFSRNGEEVIMTGQKRSFFVYDMMGGKITRIHGIRGREERFFDKFVVSPDNNLLVFLGKDGYMPLVSNKTKQWVADLKMNGSVRDVAFTPDGTHMLSVGSDGRVYVWDMAARDCVHCFTDEGCLVGTTVSISPNGRYVACGSDSGVVNVYKAEECLRNAAPRPLRAVMNLTTSIEHTCFNSTSEILAIASQQKKDALKLVHIPSLTVFSNWPTSRTPLSYVSALDLSPQSRYLAVGNDKGRVLLYRLNHYYKGL